MNKYSNDFHRLPRRRPPAAGGAVLPSSAAGPEALSFSTGVVEAERRFAYLREASENSACPVDLEPVKAGTCFVQARVVASGPLVLSHIRISGLASVRGRAEIARGVRGTVAVTLLTRGTATLDQNGRTVFCTAGDILISHKDEP